MNVIFKFAPGQQVRDLLTGVEGIVSANVVLIDGYNQVQVQPKSDDGKGVPDAWSIDDVQLKVIKGGLDVPKVFEVDFKYNVGDKVKDTILGLTGTITRAVYFLNGCIHYKIQPKMEKDLKIPEALMINEKFIESIESVKLKKEVEKDPRRGPSERIIHQKI